MSKPESQKKKAIKKSYTSNIIIKKRTTKPKTIDYLSLDSQVRETKPQWSNKKRRSSKYTISIRKSTSSSSSTFSSNRLPCLSEIVIPDPIPDFDTIVWDEDFVFNFFDNVPEFDHL
ncbi:hypothetical protein JCGZ_01449 [Jatropha curcas]|uniref:Uncharacterized protein n=1 Tax=Jatropha curcas TaxID=180498 RepID=A0A067LKS8_JATCU|nr:hypothetical protein JCGZ_01449 [Jatropha curcas]